MTVITWRPGTSTEYDQLFDNLRELHYNDHTHRLWKNYSKNSFDYAGIVANTIYFDNNNVPEVCSTIGSRECWPAGVYRILNRTWKANNKKTFLKKISDSMGQTIISQINWLRENTDCELYFASRQTKNWEKWGVENLKSQFNLIFNFTEHKYLTCPNECDDTCWQNIIYYGNENLLTQWKRKV